MIRRYPRPSTHPKSSCLYLRVHQFGSSRPGNTKKTERHPAKLSKQIGFKERLKLLWFLKSSSLTGKKPNQIHPPHYKLCRLPPKKTEHLQLHHFSGIEKSTNLFPSQSQPLQDSIPLALVAALPKTIALPFHRHKPSSKPFGTNAANVSWRHDCEFDSTEPFFFLGGGEIQVSFYIQIKKL